MFAWVSQVLMPPRIENIDVDVGVDDDFSLQNSIFKNRFKVKGPGILKCDVRQQNIGIKLS